MKVEQDKDVSGNITAWIFYCPGCRHPHAFYPGVWSLANNNLDAPTFVPELVNKYPDEMYIKYPNFPPYLCRLSITDGNITYASDCTHALKGLTIAMVDMPANQKS